MSELTDGVVVANPGGITWMIHQAATFARHDELAAYISPAAIAQAHLDELERRLPAALAGPLSGQLSLRAVPPVVPAQKVRRAVTPTEVAYVLSRRLGWPERAVKALVKRESLGFDRAVSRRLTRPGRPAAVIGYQSNAVSTFRAAARHGILRVLDYPIAHFETLEQVLSEEARLVPAYAGTMQTGYEPWKRRRYAEEIATADGIIMLSRYQQSTFEAAGVDPKRLFIAPLGVDLERFTPRAEPAEDRFRVIFCGQITQRKGISYLVEGFKRAGLPNAELLFVGMLIGGPHPWLGEPNIRHVGPLTRHQLPEVLRSGHVGVLPSLIEGYGATVVEGMACGLPAIVTPNTLADDVVEHDVDGWVVPIRDPDAIAAKLTLLYEDRELQRRMAKAARAKAEQYPWSRYGEALRSGIGRILSG